MATNKNTELNENAIVAMNAIADAFAPKAKKAKAQKSIIVIDGKICPDLMTDEEIKKTALKLVSTGATIEKYDLAGEVKLDLEVAVPTVAVASEETTEETTEGE